MSRPIRTVATVALALGVMSVARRGETLHPPHAEALPQVEGKTFTAVRVDFRPGARAAAHRHWQAFVYAYARQARMVTCEPRSRRRIFLRMVRKLIRSRDA
ncbi:MAG: hypothetical protein QOE02_775 [Rhodospirillaceae bacterium]|jgi:hypothetical protein|nr:hypothetical protein [Rhodospirillaceae bacterium]